MYRLIVFQALVDIVAKIEQSVGSSKAGRCSAVTDRHGGATNQTKPFDTMNNIVANLLLNMTRSVFVKMTGQYLST